jgi:DNA polymerase-3 subunit delta'
VSETGPQREADQLPDVTLPEQNFGPVAGHAAVRGRIDELIAAGRYPSAILFSGPRGIGKATLAFALARRILAETGDESPTRVDEQVLAGAHPNLSILRRQPRDARGFYTAIRVDEVRELRERLHQTRGRAAWRVVVVDSIDDCNASAANALLKTLEEPPPQTLFLLVSHRPGLLLPTIRSRCLAMPMRPLADAEVLDVLAAQRPDEKLDHAVSLARGCPRRGFEALALGSEGGLTSLRDWLQSPLSRPGGAGLAIADALAGEGGGGEAGFARELITAWLADEARAAALEGLPGRARLASANALWDKAQALFADEESLNVDTRQTLVALFDAIREHVAQHAILTASEPR